MYSAIRPLHFGDCDPSGIAYYPSYLKLMDSVVEDFFASLGAPRKEMIDDRKIGTPTLTLDLTFVKPGFHGSDLTFDIRVTRIGGSSLDLEHTVSANGNTLWSARQRLVATSLKTHKACAWPDDIRAALSHHLETNNA
ncbi:acyl-CoA thioesterase [Rhizobium sp. KVB221]|uniref:Acyl-CoA thioesterase n=1 Tax=Rhizobium setariae TaxID=2801340 RepID=A0A936YLQ4_9HYPH|nr:thioesterase family protein [Rhizobium setariae]MBL0372794.1 acyl-CoA thioesterase [Rhizobium setariae]